MNMQLKGLSVLFIVAIVMFSIYWRFSNPEMTETQLLISHWKEYVVMFVGVLLFILGAKYYDKR